MTAKTERADAIRWIQAQMDDYGGFHLAPSAFPDHLGDTHLKPFHLCLNVRPVRLIPHLCSLTLEELDAAGCFAPPPPPEPPPPPPPPPVVCYRNAEGLTWDGQGEMPSWLKRAVNAGQSVEFFRVG